MPSDDLQLDPGTDDKSPEGTPGNGADPAAATGLTMAEAAELINQSNAPLRESIAELNVAIGKIQTQAPAGPPQDAPGVTEEDFVTRFTNDPEGTVGGMISGQLKTVAPILGNIINSGTGAFVGLEAQQIDADFGEGAWAKYIDKPLSVILDTYKQSNVAALSDRNTITREVNGLKGQLLNELVEHRDAAKKTYTEGTEDAKKTLLEEVMTGVRTNLTGGIRRIEGGGEEVTEAVKGYLEERQRAIGGSESPKEWLARTDYGTPGQATTVEDYEAHQEKLKAAEGGK